MDMNALFHLHSFPAASENSPSVLGLQQLVGAAAGPYNLKFVKIRFDSIDEAKNRAVLLAMMTCDYLKPDKCFVMFHTYEKLKKVKNVAHYLDKMWTRYSLTRTEPGRVLKPV